MNTEAASNDGAPSSEAPAGRCLPRSHRHGLGRRYLDCHVDGGEDKRLARLWQASFCRALGFKPCADLTTAYGYVGTRCK